MVYANNPEKRSRQLTLSLLFAPHAVRHLSSALLALFFILLLSLTAAYAQISGREAVWRVTNTTGTEQPPLFDTQASPFPIKIKPKPEPKVVIVQPEEEAPEEPELTQEERIEQQRAQRASSLLSRIREALRDKSGFTPDFSSVSIEAIVSGPAGDMALVSGRWLLEGDHVQVPIKTSNALLQLQSNLQGVDQNLASIVQQEIEQNQASEGVRRLLVRDITQKGLSVRLQTGQTHVISFNSQGW